jgi:hypothetical protein
MAKRTTVGHSHRPTELDLLDILSNYAPVVLGKVEQPFSHWPPAAGEGVEATSDLLRTIDHLGLDCVKNGTGEQVALPNRGEGVILEAFVNNRKEVIQCLIVYRRGRRHP